MRPGLRIHEGRSGVSHHPRDVGVRIFFSQKLEHGQRHHDIANCADLDD
jgi:hypothetical protein